ncbi:hypothetical protein ANCCAN_05565 [Ancylostoma caninum]|uniref:CUB domain-containing protein n=1 Tax=Ancylostoma caninum TaxID=29170 RepID=A0A368GZI1_ANCCA|nr:hypothetical protein ANCCAN_05565 [Ancylostoma caninum]
MSFYWLMRCFRSFCFSSVCIQLHFQSPGQKIRFQLTYVYFKCAPTCEEFVEIKYDESLDRTGFRQCCRAEYNEMVSYGDVILILTHATENSQFVLRYRMEEVLPRTTPPAPRGTTKLLISLHSAFQQHGQSGPGGVLALKNVALVVSEKERGPVLHHPAMVRQCKHKYVTSKDVRQVQVLEVGGVLITKGACNPSGAAVAISYQMEIGVRALKNNSTSLALFQGQIFVVKNVSYEVLLTLYITLFL